jgi:hypothetical protein
MAAVLNDIKINYVLIKEKNKNDFFKLNYIFIKSKLKNSPYVLPPDMEKGRLYFMVGLNTNVKNFPQKSCIEIRCLL